MRVRIGVPGTATALALMLAVPTACGSDASKPKAGTKDEPKLLTEPVPSSELMAPSYLASAVRTRRKTHWFSMYMLDEAKTETKIGWMKLWMRPTVPGESGAYAVGIEGTWNAGDGETVSKGTRYYAPEAPYRVIGMKLEQTSPTGEKKYEATVEGKVMKLMSSIDGKAATIDVPPTKETLGTVYAQMALDPLPLRTGMTGQYFQYDVGDRKDHEILVMVEGVSLQASKTVGRKTVADIAVRNKSDGMEWRTRIAEDGIPIITNRGPVIIRLEDEASAKGVDAP